MKPCDVHDLVKSLCGGNENAFHTLIEADSIIVPELIEQFSNADDGQCRAKILETIWQHRLPSTVSFLASTLNDQHSEVWKQALDGLVTMGGSESLDVLTKCLTTVPRDDVRFQWISEAIEQIRTRTL